MEITFFRSLKIWWSFMWRAWALSFPVMAAVAVVMFLVLPISKSGQPPTPEQIPGLFSKMFLIWIVMATGVITVQALAIRWMLKTRWSDFRLVVVPNNAEEENIQQ